MPKKKKKLKSKVLGTGLAAKAGKTLTGRAKQLAEQEARDMGVSVKKKKKATKK